MLKNGIKHIHHQLLRWIIFNCSALAKSCHLPSDAIKKQARSCSGKEQETRATVGEGTININGTEGTAEQTEGLNRDTENTQEITKDQVTGATDYNITVDHEVASKAIVELDKVIKYSIEISEQVVDLFDKMSAKDVGEALGYMSVNILINSTTQDERLKNFKNETGQDFNTLSNLEKEEYYKNQGKKLYEIQQSIQDPSLSSTTKKMLVQRALEIEKSIPSDSNYINYTKDTMNMVYTIALNDPILKYASEEWNGFSDAKKRNILQHGLNIQMDKFSLYDKSGKNKNPEVILWDYNDVETQGRSYENKVYINTNAQSLTGGGISSKNFNNFNESISTIWHEGLHITDQENKDNKQYILPYKHVPYFKLKDSYDLYFNNPQEMMPQQISKEAGSRMNKIQKLPELSFIWEKIYTIHWNIPGVVK